MSLLCTLDLSARHIDLICGSVTTTLSCSKLSASGSFSPVLDHHYWLKGPGLNHANPSFTLCRPFLHSVSHVLTILPTTHNSDPTHSSLFSSSIRYQNPSPKQLHFPCLYLYSCNPFLSIL